MIYFVILIEISTWSILLCHCCKTETVIHGLTNVYSDSSTGVPTTTPSSFTSPSIETSHHSSTEVETEDTTVSDRPTVPPTTASTVTIVESVATTTPTFTSYSIVTSHHSSTEVEIEDTSAVPSTAASTVTIVESVATTTPNSIVTSHHSSTEVETEETTVSDVATTTPSNFTSLSSVTSHNSSTEVETEYTTASGVATTTPSSFTSSSIVTSRHSSTEVGTENISLSNIPTFPPTGASTIPIVETPCNIEQRINNFTFAPTRPRSLSNSKELCPGSNTRKASISCTSEGLYDLESLVLSTCESIESALNQTFTNTTLQSIQMATTNGSALTPDNAVAVSNYLANISDLNTEFSEREIGEVAEITSHLGDFYQQYPASDFASEKQDLLKSLSRISRKLQSTSSDAPSFSTTSNDINIEVRDVTLPDSSYSFNASFYSDNDTDGATFVPMSVALPTEALDEAKRRMSSSSVRIVSIGFRSSSLFPSSRTSRWVISSSLGNSTDSVEAITLTNESVAITNNLIETPGTRKLDDFKNEVTELECVFWDFAIGDWSNRGCSVRSTSPATCQCNHLTNFAILVSRSVIPADFVLSVVTYVGCGLSIIGHILTLLVIGLSKQMRGRYQMKILANICFCLLIALSLFVFGADSLVPAVGCTIITVFMHFFFLAAWFWTAVYSYTIYRDIVKTMISYGKSFKFRFAARFAYGTPFLIVLLNASIALGVIDRDRSESSYRARNFCWLHQHSLYFGFLLVIGILLLFNLRVFFTVIPEVTCKQTKIQSTKEKSGVKQHVVTVVALVTTMGLAWIFGFLMLISDNYSYLLAMSWLFTIVNVFQGVIIFYFTAVRSGELVRLCRSTSRFYSTPASSTGVSSTVTETAT